MNDQPCRRCVEHGLDCNLPRVARSQSPSSVLSIQGLGPTHPNASHSAGGATEGLMLSTETVSRYALQHPDSAQSPLTSWPPLMMNPEERQGSSTTALLPPGQTPYVHPNYTIPLLGG